MKTIDIKIMTIVRPKKFMSDINNIYVYKNTFDMVVVIIMWL